MMYLYNANRLWKWQLFGLLYAAALLAGLPAVAGWPGIAVGIVELTGVFVVYMAICAAAVGMLFGVACIGVFVQKRLWSCYTGSNDSHH